MTDIKGYVRQAARYPGMKNYYGACATDCGQFSTGNSSGYRQYGGSHTYDDRPSCKYPVIYGNERDVYNGAGPEVVFQSRAVRDTGSSGDVFVTSADFRSDCSRPVRRQAPSTPSDVEIYPWMKETRHNKQQRRQMLQSLPGQSKRSR